MEEKVDARDNLQNLLIRSGERHALQSLFGLPVVKHRQQISTEIGLETHPGRLAPDFRPEAEEFHASSSWRSASCASSLTGPLRHTVHRRAIPWLPMLP
jgi:hypothetical protein